MVKSIDELKSIIVDGMILKAGKREIEIRRFPNNIIKIHNRSIKWTALQDLLANSDYKLMVNEKELDLFEKKSNRGGRRLPGPGKTLGRNKIDPDKKKKIVSLSLSPDTISDLDKLAQEKGCSRSQYIEMLINYESGKDVSIIFN